MSRSSHGYGHLVKGEKITVQPRTDLSYSCAMTKSLLVLLLLFNLPTAHSERHHERLNCELRMRDQGGTSLCWMHSGLQMMEQMAGEPLSIDALLIPEIKSRALARYLGHDTPWDGGAGPTRPFALALEHGLVPESVWNKDSILVRHYHEVFAQIEKLLPKNLPQTEFLAAVEEIIKGYTETLPPVSPSKAREVIGSGASLGFDFRDVHYDESKYGRMGEVAWTTVISRQNDLKPITQIMQKQVIRTTTDEAWAHAIRIFREGRPVAFTFIWFDQEGKAVVGLSEQKEYLARRPAVQGSYMGSHLVLVTGLILEDGQVQALEVLDPAASSRATGFRVVTKEFFATHGKTVHAISRSCEDLL